MRPVRISIVAVFTACTASLAVRDAAAFRMIQNSGTGRTSTGTQVQCSDAGGFTHRATSQVSFWLNPASQGGKAGVAQAIQNALASWTAVTPANYTLSYAGTTSAGYTTDGINTILWSTGNGCTGSCLALTALVLGPGQVIQESDVMFNDAYTWNTNGKDYDVQAIAAHELGHCMGIHHTELTKPKNRPTMYASYFGIDGRSLETDDKDALNCAWSRYPAASIVADQAAGAEGASGTGEPVTRVALRSRVRDGHATLRYALENPGEVKLEVFDVAGRRMTTLVDGARGAGEHEVAWGGETAYGTARRGVYFARIETPEGRDIATILLGP